MPKPIDPTTHLAIDYGFAALLLKAPALLRLGVRASILSYLFGTFAGGVTLLTRSRITPGQSLSIKEHGQIEGPTVPLLLVLPWITGATRRPLAKAYFLGIAGMALANYLMTDYDAEERRRPATAGVKRGVLRRADGVLTPR